MSRPSQCTQLDLLAEAALVHNQSGQAALQDRMLRIPFDEMRSTLERALQSLGVTGERATLSARLIAETDLDGVSTHGTERFARFARMVRAGRIDPTASPSLIQSFGAFERWSGGQAPGKAGPGNLAAHAAMARAMELADTHGLGGVALANTNHWQRGGTYGWQAANAGYAAICWTNTLPNLPPWGATTPAVGNNPLVIAVPRHKEDGSSAPVVLDMAMSQFSYGAISAYQERGEPLPVPGGYDAEGRLTTDAAAIEASQRALPIGFWKGSGLAFALDVLGAMLADGQATHEIPADAERETGLTQVFLAMSPRTLLSQRDIASGAIRYLQGATPLVPGVKPLYPGERVLVERAANLRRGIPVKDETWAAISACAGSRKGS